MQVEIIRGSKVLHTLEISPSEIPRQEDTASFDGINYTVLEVVWKYSKNVGSVRAEHERLVGVDIYV
jgi:hypothetical protein